MYDQKWYVGIVEDIERGDCEVQVSSMHPKGPSTSFFWPERVDEVWMHSSQILCVVESPNMTSYKSRVFVRLDTTVPKKHFVKQVSYIVSYKLWKEIYK